MPVGSVTFYASRKSDALCQQEVMGLSMAELREPLGGRRCVGCVDSTLGLCVIQMKKSLGPLGTHGSEVGVRHLSCR